jgi:hypothetical protein
VRAVWIKGLWCKWAGDLNEPLNAISQIKRPEVDGYSALQIGAFECTPKNVNKPLQFHFQAAGVPPKRILKEFPVTSDAVLPVGEAVHLQQVSDFGVHLISSPGAEIGVRHFVAGQYVDITGIRWLVSCPLSSAPHGDWWFLAATMSASEKDFKGRWSAGASPEDLLRTVHPCLIARWDLLATGLPSFFWIKSWWPSVDDSRRSMRLQSMSPQENSVQNLEEEEDARPHG